MEREHRKVHESKCHELSKMRAPLTHWVSHVYIEREGCGNLPPIVMNIRITNRPLDCRMRPIYNLGWAIPQQYLKGQLKLNKRHAKWSEFIKSFPYTGKMYHTCFEKALSNSKL